MVSECALGESNSRPNWNQKSEQSLTDAPAWQGMSVAMYSSVEVDRFKKKLHYCLLYIALTYNLPSK